jgi:glutamate dehydrogenase
VVFATVAETSDGAAEAALLLAMAEALLGAGQSKIPKEFAGPLFARAVPEDLVRCDAREVVALAEAAWSFLADRQPGAPKIRFEQPGFAGERLRQVSVLEIVNDDMPFLVDSVMGELAERPASWSTRSLRSVARTGISPPSAGSALPARRGARVSSTSMLSGSRRKRAPKSLRRLRRHSPTCVYASPTGGRCSIA